MVKDGKATIVSWFNMVWYHHAWPNSKHLVLSEILYTVHQFIIIFQRKNIVK